MYDAWSPQNLLNGCGQFVRHTCGRLTASSVRPLRQYRMRFQVGRFGTAGTHTDPRRGDVAAEAMDRTQSFELLTEPLARFEIASPTQLEAPKYETPLATFTNDSQPEELIMSDATLEIGQTTADWSVSRSGRSARLSYSSAANVFPTFDPRFGRVAKRAIDIVGASFGLLLLAPLILAIVGMIRLTSGAGVFFRQARLGQNGQQFRVIKFRTMIENAEQWRDRLESMNESPGGVLFKIRSDPRITPFGRFLRSWSLDEIPQLLNVLRGEMSLVGPRPLPLRDSEILNKCAPDAFARRLSIPPGLTGPWQVSGRSELGVDSMLKLDLEYVDRWTLAKDLKILARTVLVVLTRKGAC